MTLKMNNFKIQTNQTRQRSQRNHQFQNHNLLHRRHQIMQITSAWSHNRHLKSAPSCIQLSQCLSLAPFQRRPQSKTSKRSKGKKKCSDRRNMKIKSESCSFREDRVSIDIKIDHLDFVSFSDVSYIEFLYNLYIFH